jgi:AraC-like DNA-binding protein
VITFNQLLDGLQIQLTPFAVCELRSGASLPLSDPAVHIHYVLQGSAVAVRRGAPDQPLPLHAVMIVPPGLKVVATCTADRPVPFPEPRCRPLPGGWDWIEVGDGEPGAVLACAHLQATHQGAIGLFDHLREPIISEMADEPSFGDAMGLLLAELAWPKAGTPALASILMKQCLILLLRRYWEEGSEPAPWLAALRHPQLGKAIAAMTQDLRSSFTLERLAESAGMSRAAFAEQFRKAYGRPPMEYFKEMRLHRAAELLATTDLTVKEVADRVGFESRSHFTRAFKVFSGLQPMEYRSASAEGVPDAGPGK